MLLYQLSLQTSKNYDEVRTRLVVMVTTKAILESTERSWVTITFNDIKNYGWGRGDVDLDGYNVDNILALAKIAKKLADGNDSVTVESVRKILSGAKQVTYDARVDGIGGSHFTAIDDIPTPEYSRWLDEVNPRQAYYSVVAKDVETAKKLMLLEAAKYQDTAFLEKFIAGGSPMRIDRHAKANSYSLWADVKR